MSTGSGDPAPVVSVIVPAYRADRTLPRCLDALLDQHTTTPYEVILVVSADTEASLPDLPAHPRLVVERHPTRVPAAVARNRGARLATGQALAFTDADVVVPPGWLDALVAASEGFRHCVAGGVRNGTPRSLVGTAEYIVAFLDLHPARPARTAWHGATCNLLVPLALWQRFGPFPEDLEGGEDTLLTAAARAAGRFRFAGDAWIEHLNRTSIRAVVRHQHEYGRFTAHLGRRGPYKLRPLVRYTPLAPLAVVARLASVYARVAGWLRGERLRAVAAAPVVVVALAAWGAGLASEGARLDRARRQGPAAPETESA